MKTGVDAVEPDDVRSRAPLTLPSRRLSSAYHLLLAISATVTSINLAVRSRNHMYGWLNRPVKTELFGPDNASVQWTRCT